MRNTLIIIGLHFFSISNVLCQDRKDTVNQLLVYSRNYLELLFNSSHVDSAMLYWDKSLKSDIKYSYFFSYSVPDSTLLSRLKNDVALFRGDFKGKIGFDACEDEKGGLLIYLPTEDEGYLFAVEYHFYGEMVGHNRLMRSFLQFYSRDKGKTWKLSHDGWLADNINLLLERKR